MLIDWFTVGAQALNFVILVWLMRRFLYSPVLKAIDAREKKIAAELADAAAKEAEADKQRDAFQHKNDDLDKQRGALLEKATNDANAERRRLLEEARKAAEALKDKQRETLRSDARSLNQAIARRTQDEVFAIARRVLADLATTSLEERMTEVFVRRLQDMNGQAKATLVDAIKKTSDAVVVRTVFELPAAQRATIQDATNRVVSAEVHIQFETTPELVSGISLSINGQKVGWSIADYLGSLEKGIGDLLTRPEPAPKSQPKANGAAQPETKNP
jgi:F-type H+-transporting ATPase subunit b